MPLTQLGPYKIERMLGRGGMGAVYVGINQETGEKAALKVLSPALADDPGFRERFKAEIETLKKLRHPNIVQLHGYGEHDGHLFYAMELVEGRNLQDELQSGRKFDWREVCRIGIAICQGLKHAHDVGVIHRDLKPANLLITSDGVIKLSDFGIAKLYGMTHLTADGGVLGTADYMAPEQADGRPVTTRCDMYSLGSVLFALLARRPPFGAPTMPEVLHALKYDEAPPVRRFAPHTPAELEGLIAELLDKDPQRRVATPLVLSNRLKAMLFALAGDKDEEPDESDDEFRLADDPRVIEASQRTTMGPEMPGDADQLTFAPTPTRPMTEAPAAKPPPAHETAPASHFTVVDNKAIAERDALAPVADDGQPLWAMLAAAAVLIVVVTGIGWYYLRTPTANELFHKISAAAEAENLSSVERHIDQFLLEYSSDERAGQVTGWREDLKLNRLQRQMEVRLRTLRSTDALSPVEQALLDAMSYERSAPETALARLEALVSVYGREVNVSQNELLCVELARRQLVTLRQRVTRSQQNHEKLFAARLAEARDLRTQNPAEARRILEGIIILYEDKPWATRPVDEARQLLKELSEQVTSDQ